MGKLEQFLNDHLKGAAEVFSRDGYVTFTRVHRSTEPKHGNHFMMINVAAQGSGVHLEFETSATEITLELAFEKVLYPGQPDETVPLVLEVDGNQTSYEFSNVRFIDVTGQPRTDTLDFQSHTFNLGLNEKSKLVKIWLPHHAMTNFKAIELNGPASKVTSTKPKWVHYGSSISHCSEAELPTGVWPVIAADALGLELSNLGLGGNAMLEPFMTDVILSHNPDVVSLKVGINSINMASHNTRTFIPAVFGLVESLAAKKPGLKILLISPIFCPPHEEGYGPTIFDLVELKATANPNPAPEMFPSHLNLIRVRAALESTAAEMAKQGINVRYLSGLELVGPEDAHWLEDDLHPNSEGYAAMGERFAANPIVKDWLAR
jgi:hypothetical protein